MARAPPPAPLLPQVRSARGVGGISGGILFLEDVIQSASPALPSPRTHSSNFPLGETAAVGLKETTLPLLSGASAAPWVAAAAAPAPPLGPAPHGVRPRRHRPRAERGMATATLSSTLPDIAGGSIPAEVSAPSAPLHGFRATGCPAASPRTFVQPARAQQMSSDPPRPDSPESCTSVSELICHQGQGGAIYRGGHLDRGIQRFRAKQCETALYRREVAKVEARLQRAVAKEHERLRRQQVADRDVAVDVLASLPSTSHPGRSTTCSKRPSFTTGEQVPVEDPDAVEIAEGGPGFDQIAQARKKSSCLQKLSLHTSGKDRVRRLNKLAKKRNAGTRVQCAQQEQLDAIPPERRFELRAAFKAFRTDAGSGATRAIMLRSSICKRASMLEAGGAVTMDVSRLCAALEVLGQEPHSDLERRTLQNLCDEFLELGDINFYTFSCAVVPRVSDAMVEVHRVGYRERFRQLDQENTGLVGQDACFDILETMCAENMNGEGLEILKEDFLELIETKREPETDSVDFEAFLAIMLWARARLHTLRKELSHRICIDEDLAPRDIQEHRSELLRLHDVYCTHKDPASDCLAKDSLLSALISCGLVPSQGDARRCVESLVQLCVSRNCNLSFSEFLGLIRHARGQCQDSLRHDLEEAFQRYDKDSSGELSKLEAYALFSERGLDPKSRHDQEDIAKLLTEVDSDNSGSIDFEEFQDLVQRLSEKKRLMQHLNDSRLARKLGFSDLEMARLREAFFVLDANGDDELSMVECKSLFASKLQTQFRANDLNTLFQSFDIDESKTLEFPEFLRFFVQLSEKLQHIAEKSKLGV